MRSSGFSPSRWPRTVVLHGTNLAKSTESYATTRNNYWPTGMNTLDDISVTRVASTTDTLTIDFDDGRTVSLPLLWYPRLCRATQAQRDHYELLGGGYAVHWPDVDEDLSAKSLALGDPSIEFVKQQRKIPEPKAA